MCIGAIPLIGLAISAASSVVGYMGQQQQYKAQEQQYLDNARNARIAEINQFSAVQHTQASEQKAAANQDVDAQIAGMRARGTALAAAGSTGTNGLSVDNMLGDYMMQQTNYIGRINSNYGTQFQAGEDQMHGANDTAMARYNSVANPIAPSFAGAAIRIAGAGLNAYTDTLKTNLYSGNYSGADFSGSFG